VEIVALVSIMAIVALVEIVEIVEIVATGVKLVVTLLIPLAIETGMAIESVSFFSARNHDGTSLTLGVSYRFNSRL
jgi:hypothetical protein